MTTTPRKAVAYTLEEQQRALLTLAYNNGNRKRTERETGISRKTLGIWEDALSPEEREELTARVHEQLEPKMSRIVSRLADRLDCGLDTLSVSQIPVALGIMTDKLRLLRGESTSNAAVHINSDPASLAAELDLILAECGPSADPDPVRRALGLPQNELDEIFAQAQRSADHDQEG